MKRGPKPKPTVLKVIAGNPGKRPLNEAEPKAPPADVKIPDGLSRREKEIWKKNAPSLINAGLLSKLDSPAFILFCRHWATHEEAQAKVRRQGMLITIRGYPMRNPYLDISVRAMRDALKIMSEFGLTPSSRSRINLDTMPVRPGAEKEGDSENDERFFGTA